MFDEHGSARKAAGSQGGYLMQSVGDPNELVVFLRWDSIDNARKFIESADLRQTMERAGVADQPDIHYLGEEEEVPA
jgi:heme-degrading monooxygenase HmoA